VQRQAILPGVVPFHGSCQDIALRRFRIAQARAGNVESLGFRAKDREDPGGSEELEDCLMQGSGSAQDYSAALCQHALSDCKQTTVKGCVDALNQADVDEKRPALGQMGERGSLDLLEQEAVRRFSIKVEVSAQVRSREAQDADMIDRHFNDQVFA
jgi:hypothetical protein